MIVILAKLRYEKIKQSKNKFCIIILQYSIIKLLPFIEQQFVDEAWKIIILYLNMLAGRYKDCMIKKVLNKDNQRTMLMTINNLYNFNLNKNDTYI